jgi:hypothetical protein
MRCTNGERSWIVVNNLLFYLASGGVLGLATSRRQNQAASDDWAQRSLPARTAP